ncbi:MAG: PilZ domain-containing protein [Methylobacter sp.]|nr:PilZ domain-containing protein [Methylobacter sp.]
MLSNHNNRRHLRLSHRAKVELISANESIIAYTKDLSDSGLFVMGSFRITPSIGDVLEVVILDIESAIPKSVVVKRVEAEIGFAVEFI